MEQRTHESAAQMLLQYTELRNALPTVMAPRAWWKQRIPIEEQITFLKAVGKAYADLEAAVMRCHPRIATSGSYTITPTRIFNDGRESPPARTPETPA